jgi:hypothetical protein
MTAVSCDVDVIRQEQKPICWVASCAMVKGYGTKTGVGVGEFTGGFDPSNSCIANLASQWSQRTDMMGTWGFTVSSVSDVASGTMTADSLTSLLQPSGPVVRLHMCKGLLYGSQYADFMQTLTDKDAHAVVLTGVDTDEGTATFDNTWGDKDQSCDLPTPLARINADQSAGKTLGAWPASS